MVASVCEGALDKIACMAAVNAAQDVHNYSIKLIVISCFSLIGLVYYLSKRQPDVHVHKKEIHIFPEPTWKKVTDAGLAGLAFGTCAYAATGIMDFTKRIVYSIFSKKSTIGYKI
jgi:hypothetical protein